jgi:Holliday junction resolvase
MSIMGSYVTGRRFEYLVRDKLIAHGFQATRVPLSGRQPSEYIPNADLIIENKFRAKAKTTKAKKYVSFPEKEIMELANGEIDFLVFNFKMTHPFVVVKFDDFIDLLRIWKEKKIAKTELKL